MGDSIVVDTMDLNRIMSIDVDAQTARVEPGGGPFGSAACRCTSRATFRRGTVDAPSVHHRGMIGNNACGSRALGTSEPSIMLTHYLHSSVTATWEHHVPAELAQGATAVRLLGRAEANPAHIRTRFGQFPRRVSGYGLEHLLPEYRRRLDRFLVGSEGTLAPVLECQGEFEPTTCSSSAMSP